MSNLARVTIPAAKKAYPHRFRMWMEQGLSPRAASALALSECDTIEQVINRGRAWFAVQPNIGDKVLAELTLLAGWLPEIRCVADAIAASLALSIPDPDEAREAAIDAVIGLRRAGYVIAAKRSEPVGRR